VRFDDWLVRSRRVWPMGCRDAADRGAGHWTNAPAILVDGERIPW